MINKKFQIFISSTYEDLKEEREDIQKAILKMQHFPIGMEMFSAGDSEQWEIIKDTIDSSDYYVVIIGHRYGSMDDEGVSYTEKEYDYAKEKKIPTLAFIRDRNALVREAERESDPIKKQKLELFIDKAKKNICDFWSSREELLNQIIIALLNEFNRKPQPGWIRADQVDFTKITSELVFLNEENRKLKEEVSAFKQNAEEIKPEILLVINDNENLELELKNEEDFANLRNDFEMLSLSDVPFQLKSYVTQEELDEYNNNLPSKEDIDEYMKEMVNYLRLKNAGRLKSFEVQNNGKAKASDIYITLKFPPEIQVMEADDVDELVLPVKPEMPDNPIDKANKKYQKKLKPMADFMNKSIATLSPVFLANNDMYNVVKRPFTKGAWLNEDNSITVNVVSLTHTLSTTITGEFALIPEKNGNYNVEVAIICNEWTEQKLYTVPILVK